MTNDELNERGDMDEPWTAPEAAAKFLAVASAEMARRGHVVGWVPDASHKPIFIEEEWGALSNGRPGIGGTPDLTDHHEGDPP